MTSKIALDHALDVIESLDYQRIAPQHGSILRTREEAQFVIGFLRRVEHVGIDYLIAENLL